MVQLQLQIKTKHTASVDFNFFSFSYHLTLGWFYVTGILIIRRSILFFGDGEILLGVMLFLTGLLILIFTGYIVSFLFIFIYGTA